MKYQTQITLYNSFFDANDNLSFKSVLNIFQDVASLHAEFLGVGYAAMLQKNLYWVLSRIKIDILKMPVPNQTVVLETWPHEKGRIDFDRDIKILSESGETLIIGTSKWCVIDTVRRMLQRTDNVNYISESGFCQEKNYQDKFGKIVVPDGDKQEKFVHTVKFSDLDHNKHMNNTNYATLAQNAVENKFGKHFEINFNAECLLDEEIVVETLKCENKEFVLGSVNGKNSFVVEIS